MLSLKSQLVALIILPITTFFVYDYSCINLPQTSYNYANIILPSDVSNNLTDMDNTPSTNPTTDGGATLGRVLFYDIDLSKNRNIACASCHIQQFAFTDTARFSIGVNGEVTGRNSMGLMHARFQKDGQFFWDNRAATLEAQTLMPIQNSVEMGLTLDTLVARVSAKSFYPALFQNAFGTNTINTDRISKALAQFIRSMNTFGSKFRYGVNTTQGNPSIVPLNNLTAQENLGKDLFMDITRGNCQACHTRNVMVQQGSKNIGLDLVYADNGVGAVNNNVNKNGQFSVPSLMNVALTAPYMHDGRFKTLEQVVDFYSDSIKAHPQLDGFLREIIPGTVNPNNNPCNTCAPRKPHYSPTEKAALVAFLKTFTDTVLTTDPRWSNPFCNISQNDAHPKLMAKAFLSSVNPTTLKMPSYLKTEPNFPLSDPYALPPLNTSFVHVNNPTVATTTVAVLSKTGNDAIVDWVFIELRNGISASTTVSYTKSALLQSDGDIVDMDGISPVRFPNAPADDYYVTIRHRNHLSFRTYDKIRLSNIPKVINLTKNIVPLYGLTPLLAINSTYKSMIAGDANGDGSIDAFDTILWEMQNGNFDDYSLSADYNLDGSADAFDTILWELNNGKFQEID